MMLANSVILKRVALSESICNQEAGKKEKWKKLVEENLSFFVRSSKIKYGSRRSMDSFQDFGDTPLMGSRPSERCACTLEA